MDTESKQGEPAAKLPHFITEARPLRVPTELLALAPGTKVSEEHRIGRFSGGCICTAADYREMIEATIARQAEDFFTVDEAAQVLADARGLDPAAMVHTLRTAQDEGELVIRDCATRLRQGKSDHRRDRRDFLDLVKGADIDAWLTASGAGWPIPAALRLPMAEVSEPLLALLRPGPTVAEPAPGVMADDARPLEHWKMRVQAEAAAEWKRLRAMHCNPTRASIRPHLLKWCRDEGVKTPSNINPSDGYLRTHVLSANHWDPPPD